MVRIKFSLLLPAEADNPGFCLFRWKRNEAGCSVEPPGEGLRQNGRMIQFSSRNGTRIYYVAGMATLRGTHVRVLRWRYSLSMLVGLELQMLGSCLPIRFHVGRALSRIPAGHARKVHSFRFS